MSRRWIIALLPLAIVGCLSEETDRFGRAKQTAIPPLEKLPKGSLEAASRVDDVGQQLRRANADIPAELLFLTIGSPQVTTFHRGTTEVYVSDGVVQRCASDGELAAVLANELAKLTIEAQSQGRVKRPPERERPFTPQIHRDGDPDMTQLAEQANYEKQNPRRRPVDAPPELAPNKLAREFLTKAGFSADDLAKAAPLIRQAESNPAFNQMVAPRNSLGIPR